MSFPQAGAPAPPPAVAAVFQQIIERSPEEELKLTVLGACMRALAPGASAEVRRRAYAALRDAAAARVGSKRPRAPADAPEREGCVGETVWISDVPDGTEGVTAASSASAPLADDNKTAAALGDFVRGVVDTLSGAGNVAALPARSLAVIAHLIDATSSPPKSKDKLAMLLWDFHFKTAAPKPRTSGKLRADTLVPSSLNVPKRGAAGAATRGPTTRSTTEAPATSAKRRAAEAAATTVGPPLPSVPAPAAARGGSGGKAQDAKATRGSSTPLPPPPPPPPTAWGTSEGGFGIFSGASMGLDFGFGGGPAPSQRAPWEAPRESVPLAATASGLGMCAPAAHDAPSEAPVTLVVAADAAPSLRRLVPMSTDTGDASYGPQDLEVGESARIADSALEHEVARVLTVKSFMSYDGIRTFLASKGFDVTRDQLEAVVCRFRDLGFVMIDHGIIYLVG